MRETAELAYLGKKENRVVLHVGNGDGLINIFSSLSGQKIADDLFCAFKLGLGVRSHWSASKSFGPMRVA
jgi:hypothetical protein